MTEAVGNLNFPENREYWQAAEKGTLLIKKCTACAKPHYYPRAHCPFCGSAATIWEESSGEGEIYSFTVVRYGSAPYSQAYVTLDERVTMMANIVDCDFDALEIGMKVRVVFRAGADGKSTPMFTPIDCQHIR